MISIIVPTYNEEEYLSHVLKLIKAQTFKDYEIIIADNSKDKTRQIAKKFGCKIVYGRKVAESRNNGAKAASPKSELFVFFDADIIKMHKNFLKEAIAEFKRRKLDFASCSMKVDACGIKGFFENLEYESGNLAMKIAQDFRPYAQGAFIMLKPEVMNIPGYLNCWGFDDDIRFAEDAEFAKRVFNAGKKTGILHQKLIISNRRFEQNGFFNIFLTYGYKNVLGTLGYEFRASKNHMDYWDELEE